MCFDASFQSRKESTAFIALTLNCFGCEMLLILILCNAVCIMVSGLLEVA